MVGLPRLWPLGADPPLLESPKITYTPKVTPTNPKQQPFVYRLEERQGGLYKTISHYMVGGGAATRSCGTCIQGVIATSHQQAGVGLAVHSPSVVRCTWGSAVLHARFSLWRNDC